MTLDKGIVYVKRREKKKHNLRAFLYLVTVVVVWGQRTCVTSSSSER